MPTPFVKRSAPIAFEKSLGLCFGWFCFAEKDGQPYTDSHGDQFPGVELLKATDALMARPAAEREINVDHAGAGRGVIATAQYIDDEIAKGLGIDTGGTSGIFGSFRPDAELLKSITAGHMFCLSVEGVAGAVETIAKSADGVEVAASAVHKRTLREIDLRKLAVVKLGAHEGAAVAVVKSAMDAARRIATARFAKRQHALTDIVDGHAHVVYDADDPDLKVGGTSYETSSLGGYGHSHSWIRNADGSIEIVAGSGHHHTLATAVEKTMPTDLEKSQAETAAARAELAKANARTATALSLPPDQAVFAKRLTGPSLESFLDATPADRAARATPIHKSDRTGRVFFAGDEALVEFAKDADATHAELAKAREDGKQAGFAKTAAQIASHVLGGPPAGIAIAKALDSLSPDDRKLAEAAISAANGYLKACTKPIGVGGGGVGDGDGPEAELEQIAKSIHKDNPSWSFEKALDQAGMTERGAALYAQAEAAKRQPRA